MDNVVFTPVTVSELVNLIASEVEARLKGIEHKEPPQDRIDLQKASDLIGLKRSAIYKLTMTGAIPFKKYRSRLVFSRKELEVWMEERTVRKKSPEEIASQQLAKAARKRMTK